MNANAEKRRLPARRRDLESQIEDLEAVVLARTPFDSWNVSTADSEISPDPQKKSVARRSTERRTKCK